MSSLADFPSCIQHEHEYDVSYQIGHEYDDSYQIGRDVRFSIATSTELTHGAIEEEQTVPEVLYSELVYRCI